MLEPFSNLDSLAYLPYNTLLDQIKPGDVIAFSGNDIPSTVVKVATESSYVHVAIVLSVDRMNSAEDAVVIAESHIDTSLPSLGTGEHILGVQLQWLSKRLASYHGPAWWAALKAPLSSQGIAKMRSWLLELERERIPYDFVQAVGAGLDTLDGFGLKNSASYSALFCSELVARALQLADAVDPEINPSEQTPADVMRFSCLEKPILIKIG